MPKVSDNPQRRRRIQQLVRNEIPGCSAVFLAAPPNAITFRIRAANGRYRSGIIKLLPHHARTSLNRAWLTRQMKKHGGPAAI